MTCKQTVLRKNNNNVDLFTTSSFRKNWALTLMVIKGYFRTFRFIFFAYFQPLFLFVIFFFIFTLKALQSPSSGFNIDTRDIISGYLILGPSSAAFFGFGLLLSSWKESILMKRMELVQISRMRLILIFIAVFFVISVSSLLWMFFCSVVLVALRHFINPHNPEFTLNYVFGTIQWGYLILGFLALVLICETLALLVTGNTNSLNTTQMILSFLFMPSVLLGGVFFPNTMVERSHGLGWASYFLSFLKCPTIIFNMAFRNVPSNLGKFTEFYQPVLVAIGLPLLLLIISGFTFRWTNKK